MDRCEKHGPYATACRQCAHEIIREAASRVAAWPEWERREFEARDRRTPKE